MIERSRTHSRTRYQGAYVAMGTVDLTITNNSTKREATL